MSRGPLCWEPLPLLSPPHASGLDVLRFVSEEALFGVTTPLGGVPLASAHTSLGSSREWGDLVIVSMPWLARNGDDLWDFDSRLVPLTPATFSK